MAKAPYDIVEKSQNLSFLIKKWPLHLFNTSIAMELDSSASTIASNSELISLSSGIDNGFEIDQSILACSRIKSQILIFKEFGIGLEGFDEALEAISIVMNFLAVRKQDIKSVLDDEGVLNE